ncbi:MAG TPA: endolytic transglycosylase MltG [Chitinophagaceae bacterium]|nr:endolytic transglycosylase MltG [Chitinophagaceae bacterium]
MLKKILFIASVLIALVAGFFLYKFMTPAVRNKQNTYFYINTGDDIATVKKKLIRQQFIGGSGFDLAGKILKYKTVKPGRYKLADGMSLYKLIRLLRAGIQSPVKLVITKERLPETFAGKFGPGKKFDYEFDSLQMIRFLKNNDSLKRFGVDTNTVMALVMPYTYETNWNTTPGKILDRFYTAYKTFWNESRKAKADSLQLSPLKVITLASIIEEETNKKSDKLNIASTYLNRVKTGMKLQADPTVKFAMKNFALKRVTGVHLKTDSPYNTYMYAGIPPGPICTPSIESIDAVLNAPATDYLYFVASSKFDGSSVFTSNYTDHMKYAREYQRELTRRMDSSRKANATH